MAFQRSSARYLAPMGASVVTVTRAAVAAGLPRRGCAVLAVSGGIDSMVLLDAAATTVPADRLIVATFDHRSGPHSARAIEHVVREAGARGLTVVVGSGGDETRPGPRRFPRRGPVGLPARGREVGAGGGQYRAYPG